MVKSMTSQQLTLLTQALESLRESQTKGKLPFPVNTATAANLLHRSPSTLYKAKTQGKYTCKRDGYTLEALCASADKPNHWVVTWEKAS
jgi:predicted signal transduction protein with EAL and GGDEF domain